VKADFFLGAPDNLGQRLLSGLLSELEPTGDGMEDGEPLGLVREPTEELLVEPSRPHQRRIEEVWSRGGGRVAVQTPSDYDCSSERRG
jgi:hypothetical protein